MPGSHSLADCTYQCISVLLTNTHILVVSTSLCNCRPTNRGLPEVLTVHPSHAPPTVQLILPSQSSILNQQDLVLAGPVQGSVSILRPGSRFFVHVSLLKQSRHGGSWRFSISPHLVHNISYLRSLTLVDDAFGAYRRHVNASSMSINYLESSHIWPNCRNVSWISLLMVNDFNALVFHLHASALTVSHPVYACIPMRALHTSTPTEAATFTITTSLARVLFPHFWNNETPILSQYAKYIMTTSVSPEQITTAG